MKPSSSRKHIAALMASRQRRLATSLAMSCEGLNHTASVLHCRPKAGLRKSEQPLALYYMSNQQEHTPATNDSSLCGNPDSHASLLLSPFAVLLAAALLLTNAAISIKFSLGWHKSLAVACLR